MSVYYEKKYSFQHIEMKNHNLEISTYSLNDILGLFDLTYNISIYDLKRAKKTVLMTHPDKSKLGPEYFLFYKKAFDIVLRFYEQQQKENQEVPKEEIKYVTDNHSTYDKNTNKKITSAISEMSTEEFHRNFNRLFDENMAKKQDESRNAWFKEDDPSIIIDETVTKQNMGEIFEKVKEKQSTMILSQYRGVENLYVGGGTRLYEDLEDNTDEYVTCDPFSKLKFDDLRKVHKDQSVIAVSERDFSKVPQYKSVDHFMRERGKQSVVPLDKIQAESILENNEKNYRERMMQMEHLSGLRSMENEEKKKSILAGFLRIGNIS
jgi:hypothetical protein